MQPHGAASIPKSMHHTKKYYLFLFYEFFFLVQTWWVHYPQCNSANIRVRRIMLVARSMIQEYCIYCRLFFNSRLKVQCVRFRRVYLQHMAACFRSLQREWVLFFLHRQVSFVTQNGQTMTLEKDFYVFIGHHCREWGEVGCNLQPHQ